MSGHQHRYGLHGRLDRGQGNINITVCHFQDRDIYRRAAGMDHHFKL